MTTKVKKLHKGKVAIAVAAALETREMQNAPEHLSAVKKFQETFEKLAVRSQSLMFDVKVAVLQVIEHLNVPATKEGHKKTMLVVKGCTQDSSVIQYAKQWASVILGEAKGLSLGTLDREGEPGVWGEIPASVELLESRAELGGASIKANIGLGMARKSKKTKAESTITTENVFDYLAGVFKSTAGIAKLKEVCAAHGYDLTVAKPKEDFSLADAIQGAAHRKSGLRKAA